MFYTITIAVFLIDLLSKQIATAYLQEKIEIIGNFIYLQLIHNSGIAFGIHVPSILLKIGTLFLILGLFYYYRLERSTQKIFWDIDIAFGFIIGGALANAYERIFYHQVVDFIGVKYFAIFNIADIAISLGALLYMYTIYKTNKTRNII